MQSNDGEGYRLRHVVNRSKSNDSPKTARLAHRSIGRKLCILIGFQLLVALVPAGAAQAAECTNTWTGAAEGTWQTAGNWSTGKVPTTEDVACIGSGKTVNVTAGTNKAAIVQGEGTLTVKESTLELLSTGEPSSIKNLTVKYNAVLTGPGTINVSNTFAWTHESTMSGTGATVVGSGATGSITTGGGWAYLTERKLVNEGSFAVNEGVLRLKEGAILENKGTLTVNHEAGTVDIFDGGGTTKPKIVNSGLIQKTSGSGETNLEANIENSGEINAKTGTFFFNRVGGTGLLATGTTLKGSIRLKGPAFTGESFDGKEAKLTMREASLSVNASHTATIGTLVMDYKAEPTGAGTLEITKGLTWESESTMSGAGSTVVKPSATATVTTYNGYLTTRTLKNEGTFTFEGEGSVRASESATFENTATLNANAVVSWARFPGILTKEGSKSPPVVVNKGTIQRTAGTSEFRLDINVQNYGTITAKTGKFLYNHGASTVTLHPESLLEGTHRFEKSGISGNNFKVPSGTVSARESPITLEGKNTSIANLEIDYGTAVSGTADLEVTQSFKWNGQSTLGGSGKLTLAAGTANVLDSGATVATLSQREIINKGTFTQTSYSKLLLKSGAIFRNQGTYNLNSEPSPTWVRDSIRFEVGPAGNVFMNEGLFQRTEGKIALEVTPEFLNLGVLKPQSSGIEIKNPVTVPKENKFGKRCQSADPVECATGDFTESQMDVSIGGRGIGLYLTRGYSAQAAAVAVSPGPLGYGWSSSFREHLTIAGEGEMVTFVRGNGSSVPFSHVGGSVYSGPSWAQETLSGSTEGGFTLVRADQVEMHFSGTGKLEDIVDRNGNETTLSYDLEGRLEAVTDPGGRQLTFAYNEAGLVKSVEDPMGHLVTYAYEGSNLASVTLPGAAGPRWQYKYDGSHRITSVTDGRGGKTTNEYDGSSRVISQTDPTGRTQTFKYEAFHTTITNKATGAVTDEWFTSNNQPYSVTRGYGTPYATTETFGYDGAGHLIQITDGNGHTTTFGYDEDGNRTSEKSPAGETKWTYNGTHDVTSVTKPGGTTTTFARDGNGNLESASSPGPGETTQTTTFGYDENGQLESITDPLERTWSYDYDSFGNRTSEVDPLGNERTWAYDEDSRLISTVSPRGNLEGAEPAKFESTVERDLQGQPVKVTDPLGHSAEYSYDGNGNVISTTDAKGNTTKYVYNGYDQRIKVEKPSGAVLKTGYDGAGLVTSQTDGNEATTTYVRNVLGQPVEVIDPLGRKTTAEFDDAGNPVATVDAAERETTYTYDTADRLTKISYSDEETPDVEFEYDADGNVTSMVDGTGESTFSYDELGRLTHTENGHGDDVEYQYDLADQVAGLVYPNGKTVSRAYDLAGRLESVTDWLGGTTSFLYDADSNLEQIAFPSGSGNVDEYTYDQASRMTAAKFTGESKTLASLGYGRDPLGQVEEEIREGLPGPGVVSYGYDKDNRLIEAGAATFEYDSADNLTKGLGSSNAYDAASQLESGTGISYGYDKLGQRVEASPSGGPATSYGYDQAGNLVSIERPEEGEIPALAESFAYDGNGQLASKTSGMATRYLTWDSSAALPSILSDEANSFIYGVNGLPIEQISAEEAPTYIHHDHLGSSRLLTDAGGEVSAALSYGPYGGLEGKSGSGSTPLGFAGQYTDSPSGLQYLRARFYDSATGQFMSQDPIASLTRAPYTYAGDNPVNMVDPSGMCGIDPGDWLENINITSEENCAYQAAEELNDATGIDLPGILSSPPVVSAVAGGICLAPVSDLVCGAALIYAFATGTAGVLEEGFESEFCDVPNLLAKEAINGILLWFSGLASLAGDLAKTAPPAVKAIIQGGPAAAQGGLDAAQSKHGR